MKQNTFRTKIKNHGKLMMLILTALLLVQLAPAVSASANSVSVDKPAYQTRFTRQGTFFHSIDRPAADDSDLEPPVPKTAEVQVAAGLYHSAMIYYDHTLYFWGDNTYGQLGHPNLDYSDSPVPVIFDDSAVSVSLGAYHSLVLTSKGHVYAFGRNTFGQLGNRSIEHADRPSRVEGLPQIMAISAGAFHSMALGLDGSVWAWGNNSESQIGLVPDQEIYDQNETLVGRRILEPVKVINNGIIEIAAGGHHSLALHENGQVYAWGANDRGQLGNGTTQSHGSPSLVAGLEQITQIAAGYQHNLAVTSRDNDIDMIWTWGDDSFGQLGLGSDLQQSPYRSLPAAINWTAAIDQNPVPQTIVKIAAGAGHSAFTAQIPNPQDAIETAEKTAEQTERENTDAPERHYFLIWGNNSNGQLGRRLSGNALNIPELYRFTQGNETNHEFHPFQDIALGGYHTLLLSSKALAAAAGRGDSGQLGTLSIIDRYAFTPVDVPDVIQPFFAVDSYLQASWQEDGKLLLRWPQAFDNADPDVKYRLSIRTDEQDAPPVFEDAFDDLAKVISHLSQDQPFEVILTASDTAYSDNDWTQLSRLVLYYMPAQYDGQTPETQFETVYKSIQNASGIDFMQGSHEYIHHTLDVPWDLTSLYGSYVSDEPVDSTALWISSGLAAFLLLLSGAAIYKRHQSDMRPAGEQNTAVNQ